MTRIPVQAQQVPEPVRRVPARALVGAALGVLVVVGLVLVPAQQDARRDRVTDLAVSLDPRIPLAPDPVGDSVSVGVRLRNDGPRPLVVRSAGVAGLAFGGPALALAPGESRSVSLEGPVACEGGAPAAPLPTVGEVSLAVTTADGRDRPLARPLALGDPGGVLAGVCRVLDDLSALSVGLGDAAVVGRALVAPLTVVNLSRRARRLLSVTGPDGFAVELRRGGVVVRGPLQVAVDQTGRSAQSDAETGVLDLQVRVRLTRCALTSDDRRLTVSADRGPGTTPQAYTAEVAVADRDALVVAACP